ncbi:MAG TPA: pyridoxamine 5'-phosphate oxidase family protein [Baekduia sp.]|nr:pyridoxamine 5'-phosphate oxidase family protein [Baekduia sp.]
MRDRMAPTVRRLLETTLTARVATTMPDGAPHAAPFWIAFDGERLYLDTLENQTVRNLRRDARVAVLVDVGEAFAELEGAVVAGRAVVYEEGSEPARVRDGLERIRAAHAEEIASPEFAAYAAAERRPLAFVEIVPERIRYWNLTRGAGAG